MFYRTKHFIDLFVVQPTTFCNINCSYCYLPDRDKKKNLTPEILSLSLGHLKADKLIGPEFTLVWHAGEPLATGLKRFRELVEIVEEFSLREKVRIKHSIQTNGVLINQEWCDLFKKYDIRIGISIDGPKFLHDANRLTRTGRGTFDLVIKGIGYLKKNDIPYHAIAVVTKRSLDFPKEIFSFFSENGFYNLGLNIEEIEGINSTTSLAEDPELDKKFSLFWQSIYDLYKDSDQKMRIREFDQILKAIFQHPGVKDIKKLAPHSHQIHPFAILTMDTDGNFSTFSPELLGQECDAFNNFVFGNVREQGFLTAAKQAVFKTVQKDIEQGVNKCRDTCKYFYLCGGGAPSNKFYENGTFDSTTTLYCRYTVKGPIDVVLKSLELQAGTNQIAST